MRRYLLFALMLSGMMTSAQTSITNGSCKAQFKYEVNDKLMTLLPATAINFYDKSEGKVKEWKWDFGDGSSSDKANPTHIFNLPLIKESTKNPDNGNRKVCLNIKTASGCIANYCETINIYNNGIPIVEPQYQCHAWFKYYKPIDVISNPVLMPYKLVDASEGIVIKRLWQFEEGKTSTDAEPLVSLDLTRPIQKVCLTIYTADSCMSTWCDNIYVSDIKPDTASVPKPELNYRMRYTSSFPVQMSSCAGYVKAQVYLNDSLIKADRYFWSTGAEGQELKGLCPTKTYTVKAKTPGGIYVTGTFVFNSDGTVKELPINWWITGKPDEPIVQYDLSNKEYTVEWRLCDGTIVKSDSIPLNSINCGTKESNLILKDSSGKIVYTENISRDFVISGINTGKTISSVKLFPNPVTDLLNIQYSGDLLSEMKIEIYDNSGKRVSMQKFYDVASGQQINLNVSSLRKGIYICKMSSGNRIIGIEKFSK